MRPYDRAWTLWIFASGHLRVTPTEIDGQKRSEGAFTLWTFDTEDEAVMVATRVGRRTYSEDPEWIWSIPLPSSFDAEFGKEFDSARESLELRGDIGQGALTEAREWLAENVEICRKHSEVSS